MAHDTIPVFVCMHCEGLHQSLVKGSCRRVYQDESITDNFCLLVGNNTLPSLPPRICGGMFLDEPPNPDLICVHNADGDDDITTSELGI